MHATQKPENFHLFGEFMLRFEWQEKVEEGLTQGRGEHERGSVCTLLMLWVFFTVALL